MPRMRIASSSRSTPMRVGIGGIFRALEADRDMALGGEVVDLGRPDLLHQPDQVGGVGHVAVMQQERHVAGMRILIEMIDAARC